MSTQIEILNMYRHIRGLYHSITKLAQDEKVVKCWSCRTFHTTDEPHAGPSNEKMKDKNAEPRS